MSITEEQEDSGEEATDQQDATEQQQQDPPTTADDKWIHSAAKKSLQTDIILGKVTTNSNPKDVYEMCQSYKGYPLKISRLTSSLSSKQSPKTLQGCSMTARPMAMTLLW
jgi:hypothetical protein